MSSNPDVGEELAFFVDALTTFRQSSYVFVACAAVLTYDLAIHFEKEVRLVWRSKWTFSKALYFFNRYGPISDLYFGTLNQVTFDVVTNCSGRMFPVIWIEFVGLIASESILMLRTFALWRCSPAIGLTLLAALFTWIIPSAILLSYCLSTLKYAPPPTPYPCFIIYESSLSSIPYVLFCLCETVVIALVLFKCYRYLLKSPSRLVHTMWRDGVVFFVFLFAISITNIGLTYGAPLQYANNMTVVLRTVHSIFSSYVVLHIREYGYNRRHGRDAAGSFKDPFSIVDPGFISDPDCSDPAVIAAMEVVDRDLLEDIEMVSTRRTSNALVAQLEVL